MGLFYLLLVTIWLTLNALGSGTIYTTVHTKYTRVESDHSYPNSENVYGSLVTRNSASYYHIEFSSDTETEFNYDYVRIYHGSQSGSLLYSNSGSVWDDVVLYAPSGLVFGFTSDGSSVRYGFAAYVSAHLTTTTVDSNTRTVQTPHNYPNNFVAHSSLIQLASSYYEIEWDSSTSTESCCDKVRIFTGNQDKRSTNYLYEFSGPFGSFTQPLLITSSSGIFFEFQSDASVDGYGFAATVRSTPPTANPTANPTTNPTPLPSTLSPTIQRYIVTNPTGNYSCQTNENPGTLAFNECFKV